MALEDLFREALGELLANEYTLVRKDAHEQSLCGRLAIYLDRLKDKYGYEPYYVDVEYNRRGEGIKEIPRMPCSRAARNVKHSDVAA